MAESLSLRAHNGIIRMILTRELPPGAVLQEAALAEALAMSRTGVREAIQRIEAEGLAVHEGRFLKVRNLSGSEVREIFALRAELEGFAARHAVALPLAQIDAMEATIRTLMAEGPGEGESEREVDDAFHAMLARVTQNATLERQIAELRLRTCMFDASQVPERFRLGAEEHLGILAALRARDGALAEARMRDHADHACEAILRLFDGLAREHGSEQGPAE